MAAACLADGRGRWMRKTVTMPSYTLPASVPLVSHGIRHAARYCGTKATNNSGYLWVPEGNSCDVIRLLLNTTTTSLAKLFCKEHSGRRVLIVGDSLSGLWFVGLALLLADGNDPMFTSTALPACGNASQSEWATHASAKVCPGGSTSLSFIRNGHVSINETQEALARARQGACLAEPSSHYQPWVHEAANADVIVLNRGAWAPHDTINFTNDLASTMDALASLRKRPRIVWRGTSAAIPHCWSMAHLLPAPYRFDLSEQPDLISDKAITRYHYHLFAPLNAIARRMVEAAGHLFFDTYIQTALRPGGRYLHRRDCLHFCLPGMPDEWSRLLFVLLTQHSGRTLHSQHTSYQR